MWFVIILVTLSMIWIGIILSRVNDYYERKVHPGETLCNFVQINCVTISFFWEHGISHGLYLLFGSNIRSFGEGLVREGAIVLQSKKKI